ncbi:hypothetical protein MNBD_ACTINO02-1060, partial [hydrothermal vent metagenome]
MGPVPVPELDQLHALLGDDSGP